MDTVTTDAGDPFMPEADARAHAQIGALLRRVWAESPPPAWTQERADQIFASVMITLERRQRRKRAVFLGLASSVVGLPLLWLLRRAWR